MNRTATHSTAKPDWVLRLGLLPCAVGLSLGACLALSGSATSAEGARGAPATAPKLVTKPIEQVRVGERVVGRNPLREQVAHVEPDPATWRQVSLFLTKESGNGLWIELLRPLTWLEEQAAQPGGTIFLELPEMGAVGDAQVLAVSPCPVIQPVAGPIVTGTFKHQADAHSHVIRLALEDQPAPTTVTSNHPYWSADRQSFIPAGDLRPGELVDTALGPKRVLSLTPLAHTGFLYNLETTEHVYRVGSVGTLVHNSCILSSKMQTLDLGGTAWRRSTFSEEGLVYILRNAKTGELLKVGQSTSATFVGRFEKYVTAARRNGIDLAIDVFEVPLKRRGAVEGEIRRTLGQMVLLPWDNTGGRLGFPGPGVP